MEKSQISFEAILRGEARMYRFRVCRLFYRGIRFHRVVRCGKSAVLDREGTLAPRGVCGLHTFCSDPKTALIRTGDGQVTFRRNFGASASLNCYNGRDETTGPQLELLAH